jgi:hypothetical protein
MNKNKVVVYTDKVSGKVLKTFTYPIAKGLTRFFWEKLKQEQLKKLCRHRDIEEGSVIVTEWS